MDVKSLRLMSFLGEPTLHLPVRIPHKKMSAGRSSEQQELLDNCSLLLNWLSLPAASTPSSASTRPTLANYQICESSRPNATFSYVIAISNDAKCYVALSSNVYAEKLLEVQSPVDILKGISSGTTIGTISGQLSTFPAISLSPQS
jgi:hypothetical protein